MLASIKNEVIISSKSIRVDGKKAVSASAGKIANEVVSLKPNFFGIGVDINAVINKINQWKSSKG